MDRSTMLKLMFKFNKVFTIINKYLYILPLITIITNNISYLKDNKIFIIIIRIIKILIILSIVLSGLVVLYFIDFTNPLSNTYSFYLDLLEPYIEIIKSIWNKLIDKLTSSPGNEIESKLESVLKESISQVRNEVKLGIKEGVREVVGEILEELQEETVNSNTNLYKNIALTASGLFLFYILFALPSSPISPQEFTQYNWFNQGLIEFKLNIVSFFTNPGNPGNPSNPGTPSAVPSSPVISDITEVPVFRQMVDAEAQTIYDGTTVSRSYKAVDIMINTLDKETANQISDGTVKIIKTITD